ncbi:hypothetical protein COLO4_35890 [Corchorus olitorius]|uniref:Gnk2-homologous domain-containing protein n=1 Tax=Corchorus olitorius TaxID=93759 RepID=A0A1R3GC67_9ROSI|nr:hypothetical protein COLO4_35890 [Corchorus olitorius]
MKIFPVLVLVISAFSFTGSATPIYWYHFCSNVSGNSVFVTNRNNLVSDLSNATVHGGFYNTTVGQNPNIVHGLFLCRGDLNPENCQNCVKLITSDVSQRCPNQTGGLIWYDQCMLHYSDTFIFSTMELEPKVVLVYNNMDIMEPDRFKQVVATVVRDVAIRASNASLGAKKFATEEATYKPPFLTVYSRYHY